MTVKPKFKITDIQIGGETVAVILNTDLPTNNSQQEGCYICGWKVNGGHSYEVQMGIGGYILPYAYQGGESQGCFDVGSSCKNRLPKTHYAISTLKGDTK